MQWRIPIVCAMTLCAPAGCAMLAGIDGDYRVTTSDASTADGTTDASIDGSTDAGWPRILDPGFEEPVSTSECGEHWITREGTATRVEGQGRDGGAACMLCLNPGQNPPNIAFVHQFVAGRSYPAGTYGLSGEFRQVLGVAPFANQCIVQIGITDDVGLRPGSSVTLANGWRSSSTPAVTYDGGPPIDFHVTCLSGGAATPVCALVDNVVLTYSPPP